MTEQEFDNLIREVLLLAAEKRLAETPDWQGELSPKYRRRFKQMLANPKEYAKRRQETPWKKLRRYAAAAVLLLAMAGGSFFWPQLQIIAGNLAISLFDGYNGYTFVYRVAQNNSVLPEIEIGYIPEGYTLCEQNINEIKKHAVWYYVNNKGDFLSIGADINESGLGNYFDNEHHSQQYVTLANRQQALLLKGEDDSWQNILLWTTEKDDIVFMVSGKIPAKELMKIAENIILK